jgi:hypothetical protein
MVTLGARLAALAGAIAVGVLCEALVCKPAQAGVVAFEGTQSTSNPTLYYATLDLYNSSGALVAMVSTDKFQGWVSNSTSPVIPPNGGPSGYNTAYTAGSYGGSLLVDYFGFNLANVSTNISSAKLVLYSGTISNDLTYTLFGATQWVSELSTLSDHNAALYASLVSGTNYGGFQLAQTNNALTKLTFTFAPKSDAVAGINAAIQNRNKEHMFVMAGEVSAPVPEPSTWVMMLAGFAGLGVLARRRAIRRRAAALAS